ncbi:MAG: hypothetical protein A2653_02520 [Candidatus Zambryskibacteria bacterium RIFCSPHIGHO2_01_FULL_43_25]|uniref:histidine kinase n=1 Tax=Candidatus Zambryskibacteria bacterium RIFCSPLOWO2_01_FULL_45_21 TaxID=1802761 RepID=A0A1G2U325_9BACT|nr:MAG: hypothetical protein A2653_02520 [Candidatus Zambryskibacteria bacterium RIFCSPHIGHO2_01_FULL_43_25]OHB01071.1 MAG: hypothetical protein A3E94_02700 [Candidatus Zambryskibacteria bacterium RIFCSPHIGHO2_12_FULL_44_12b]OHB03884.1 MAG: hypothetical protein A3B14_00930 [Candidatus Zambryskibacteria bacterium RIFCSPLOWO2_01_FULL_45_21]
MIENILCPWESPSFLLFSSNVPQLLYYSHFPVIVISALLGGFIYRHRTNLASSILVIILTLFSFYALIDVLIWATNRSDIVLFLWSIQVMVEVLVFAFSLYLIYLVLNKKDAPFRYKLITGIILAPFIILIPTSYNLIGIDLSYCDAVEGPIALYVSYALEILFAAVIIGYSLVKYHLAKERTEKRKAALLGTGIMLFLFAFIWGNIIGSYTGNWNLAQYGFFGMPAFSAFLVYLIVEFKLLNLKLVGAQALVVATWISMGALLLVRTFEQLRIIVVITLVFILIAGVALVRSVKREVEQREKIEKLALDLEKANAKLRELDQLKSEFLSFASHQIRSPLTAIHGYATMLEQGDYGEMSSGIKEAIGTMSKSSASLVKIVNEFLDISRIEQGRMKYDLTDFDLKQLVFEAAEELKPNIEEKGLTLNISAEEGDYMVNADRGKIKQVIGNLIDNSVKYTSQGSIEVKVKIVGGKILITTKDTGIGIEREDISKLFSKFTRTKDAHKTDVTGTGLGLYVAKQMIEAHKGRIWVESEGNGRGSTFFVELPAK